MKLERIGTGDDLWSSLVAHLGRVKMARWVLDEEGSLKARHVALGVVVDGEVVGNLILDLRPLVVPESEWSAGRDHAVYGPDGEPLTEAFVATFAVDEEHRRRGHGRALQLAALELSAELGAWQMRSWSSLDKPANYALKVSMGFAATPASEPWGRDGQVISGVYFAARTREVRTA